MSYWFLFQVAYIALSWILFSSTPEDTFMLSPQELFHQGDGPVSP